MSSKTNTSKTAHVMNLLSKTRTPPPATEPSESPVPQERGREHPVGSEVAEPAAQPAQPVLPPMIASMAPDAAVSSQIRSALETSLEAELAKALGAEVSPSPSTEGPSSLPHDSASSAPSTAPSSGTAQQTSTSQAVDNSPAPQEVDFVSLNVMELLVEEKAPRYMQMMKLCTCPRCAADVKALALNNLPIKYVVLPKDQENFCLTLYRNRFDGAVTAQLVRACSTVLEHPRHTSQANEPL